jgi:hypothetical protein
MANEFIIKKGLISKANSVVSGSLIVTEGASGSFSGSFEGDGSGLTNVPTTTTASYALTASYVETAQTASYVLNAVSSSYALYAVSASHEIIKEVSSSYADTASFAQSGNGIFSGSFSGSFEGISNTSSYALTASYVETAQTASYVISSSIEGITNYVRNDQTSSMTVATASYVETAQTASYALNAVSSSYSSFAVSASYAVSASHEIIKEVSSSYADTASFAQSGDGIFSGSFSGSFDGTFEGLNGKIGIANSSGSYTYYTTLSQSVAAASPGDTIELFANIEEYFTTDISTHLKNDVDFNFNGHTYFFTGSQAGVSLLTDNSTSVTCSFFNGKLKYKESDDIPAGSSNYLLRVLSGGSFINLTGFEVEIIDHEGIIGTNQVILNKGTIVGGTYIAREDTNRYIYRGDSANALLIGANIFYYGVGTSIYNYFGSTIQECNIYNYSGTGAILDQSGAIVKDSTIYSKTGYAVKGGEVRNCNIHAVIGDGHDQVSSGQGGTFDSYIKVGGTGNGIKVHAEALNNVVEHGGLNAGSAINIVNPNARVYGGVIIARDFGTSYPILIGASDAIIENVSIRQTYPVNNAKIIRIATGVTNPIILNCTLEVSSVGGTHVGISAADTNTPVYYAGLKFINKSSGAFDPIDENTITQAIENTTDPYGNLVVN